jgi:DNA adenine methylase
MTRMTIAKADTPPQDDQPLELVLSVVVKGETRKALEALPPESLKALLAKGLVAAINKSAEEPPPPTPARTFKRAILSKAEGAEEERYVLGIAMEPDAVDSQGDTQSAEEIRKAAFAFMEAYRNGGDAGHMGLMHKQIVDEKLALLESYIQKADEVIEGETVKAGSWLVAIRVMDDEIWKQVQAGDLTGFSIGGTAVKEEVD